MAHHRTVDPKKTWLPIRRQCNKLVFLGLNHRSVIPYVCFPYCSGVLRFPNGVSLTEQMSSSVNADYSASGEYSLCCVRKLSSMFLILLKLYSCVVQVAATKLDPPPHPFALLLYACYVSVGADHELRKETNRWNWLNVTLPCSFIPGLTRRNVLPLLKSMKKYYSQNLRSPHHRLSTLTMESCSGH